MGSMHPTHPLSRLSRCLDSPLGRLQFHVEKYAFWDHVSMGIKRILGSPKDFHLDVLSLGPWKCADRHHSHHHFVRRMVANLSGERGIPEIVPVDLNAGSGGIGNDFGDSLMLLLGRSGATGNANCANQAGP